MERPDLLRICLISFVCLCMCYSMDASCPVDMCEWFPWETWSSCTWYCQRYRSRLLCCPTELIGTGKCDDYCETDSSGYSESGLCAGNCNGRGSTRSPLEICDCDLGFTGFCCEENIDDCKGIQCRNGAWCNDGINTYTCMCPVGFRGQFCEIGDCQPYVTDMVFVLDSSASQTESMFNKQLQFVNTIIDHIDIGNNDFLIAVVTFSFDAKVEFKLGEHMDKDDLKKAVTNIKFRRGATFTNKGLDAARKVFNDVPARMYGKTANRYVIVLTDGMSNDRSKTKHEAIRLKQAVSKVFAIGVGREVSHQELLDIATPESPGEPPSVFSVENFNALQTIAQQLVSSSCEKCVLETSTDMVFLIDAATSMALKDFQIALNAVTYLTDKLMSFNKPKSLARVALVSYGQSIKVHQTLTDHDKLLNLVLIAQTLKSDNEYCNEESCDAKTLDEALLFVQEKIIIEHKTVSTALKQMIIVLSNGQQEITEIGKELENVKAHNISVYAVGVGEEANLNNLQKMSGDASLVFSVTETSGLTPLDAVVPEIFFSSCNLNKIDY